MGRNSIGDSRPRSRGLPADQRLGADDARRSQVDQRLVVQHELVSAFGQPEARRQRQVAAGIVLRLAVHAVAVAATLLGGIQGGVRVLEQPLGRVGVGRVQTGPDAGRHVQVVIVDLERPRQRQPKCAGDRPGCGVDRLVGAVVRRAVHQHQELVAALPGNHVIGSDRASQAGRHLHQKLVADLVAEAVVYQLEVVQVDEEHRQAGAGALGVGDADAQMLLEQRSVRQVGEFVVHCLVSQPGLGVLERGDVEGDTVDVLQLIAVVDPAPVALHPAHRSVAVTQPVVDHIGLTGVHGVEHALRDHVQIVGVDEAPV